MSKSKSLTTVPAQSDLIVFTEDQVGLIKRTLAKDASDDELAIFLHQCKKTGLDPMAKQIYFRKQRTKNGHQVTIITGIDGYRLVADRTGNYAGNDDPVFDNEENPARATVTVYKIVGGIRCPYSATARWSQYYPGDAQGFMWLKMPHLMLGKCAEALALRKAFPAELSGIYVKEEMDQAEREPEHQTAPLEPAPRPRVVSPPPVASSEQKLYHGSEPQQVAVKGLLKKQGVPEEFWEEIHNRLLNRPVSALPNTILEVKEGI